MDPPRPHYPAIGDYAIIGDCRCAALISREGSVDWLCLPRFDSPSTFGALLDARRGGRFQIAPTGRFRSSRRYLPETNVLETTFETRTGTLRVIDLMPVVSEDEKKRLLLPIHQLLRLVECVEGEVGVEVRCDPRPEYGAVTPTPRDRGALGIHFDHKRQQLVLRSEIPLEPVDGAGVGGHVRLREGERRAISLVVAVDEPAVIPPLGAEADARLERTVRWWREWASRCRYEGPQREHVVRSALTLKLLTFAPSGALVAAPTASLPERLGGVRNWDYRYCWLRDASLVLRALFDLGYHDEGEAFLAWMLHATRLTWPRLQILYDVHGETRLAERELGQLEGYAGSRPVRVGNGATGQLQLDVYGEVMDAAWQHVQRGGALDGAMARALKGFGRTVCRSWKEPDEGIWETRGGPQQHTLSKAMCWVALDRLIRLHEAGQVKVDVDALRETRDAIREVVEERGYDPELGSYVSELDGHDVDANLLLLGIYGYADPGSERMRGTLDRIREKLGTRGSLIYRYLGDDGLPSGEGAFGICSFWAVELQARQGDREGAASRLEELCAYANDVGLLAEEIDPATGRQLGNFPQAFTHVGLIHAALALADAQEEKA